MALFRMGDVRFVCPSLFGDERLALKCPRDFSPRQLCGCIFNQVWIQACIT